MTPSPINPEKIILENILLGFSMMTPFSKKEAAFLVGSRRLKKLIMAGKIEVYRNGNSKTCTWYCNSVQVLNHIRDFRRVLNRKKQKL